MDRVSSFLGDAEHRIAGLLPAETDDCRCSRAVGLAVHPFANFRAAKHSGEDTFDSLGHLGRKIEPSHPSHIGRGLAVNTLAKVRVAEHSYTLLRTLLALETEPGHPRKPIARSLAVYPFAKVRVAKHSHRTLMFRAAIEPGHPSHIAVGLAVHPRR